MTLSPMRPVEDHGAGDRGHALEVVGGAVGDAAEDHLLGRPSREQHHELVDQLLAGARGSGPRSGRLMV